MAVFTTFKISWTQHHSGLLSSSQLVLPYTEEEESWLVQQFRLLDEAHNSVCFGEEMTREFMMYSLDVPVSKTYVKGKFSAIRQLTDLRDIDCTSVKQNVMLCLFVSAFMLTVYLPLPDKKNCGPIPMSIEFVIFQSFCLLNFVEIIFNLFSLRILYFIVPLSLYGLRICG
jgi:hypothetical protein